MKIFWRWDDLKIIFEDDCKTTRETLKNALALGANLEGANLRGADLEDTHLEGANLEGAKLRGAKLRGADLGNFPVKISNIHRAVFDAATASDESLDMARWHVCETTHCRAGWVIHLAGEAGYALEWALTTSTAAALIYANSDPLLERIPDFHCSDDEALADMKRFAELEAAREVAA